MKNETMNLYKVEVILAVGIIEKIIRNDYEINIINIIAENEQMYCLDDGMYRTVSKLKESYMASLNKFLIRVTLNDTFWGTSIKYSEYTFDKRSKNTIKKRIQGYIDKEYCMLSNLNLKFLDEKKHDIKTKQEHESK